MVKGGRTLKAKILTNMQKIARSENPLAQDDIFAIMLPSGMFIFGQVILVEPPREQAPGPACNLIYIFSKQHENMKLDGLTFDINDLLIPPLWTNALGWKKGYFYKVGVGSALTRLRKHCFRRYNGTYLDERKRLIPHRIEPCGEWGLVSYRWIDDHVSDALGIPRVPEDG